MTCINYDSKVSLQGFPIPTAIRLTPEGIRFAITYTKLDHRVLPPLVAANQQPAPIELQRALCTIENYVGNYLEHAKPKMAS